MNLLRQTKESFVAFCDHDDIWIEDKLEMQVNHLLKFSGKPALTHCGYREVENRKVGIEVEEICQNHKLENLVAENCAKGCTIAMNGKARDLLMKSPRGVITWHDWWCVSVISAIGIVHSAPEPMVLYRLHENNLIGKPNVFHKVNRFCRRPIGEVVQQYQLLLDSYKHLMRGEASHEIEEFLKIFQLPRYKRAFTLIREPKRRKSIFLDTLRRIAWSIKAP